jgi:hypothetical protein
MRSIRMRVHRVGLMPSMKMDPLSHSAESTEPGRQWSFSKIVAPVHAVKTGLLSGGAF